MSDKSLIVIKFTITYRGGKKEVYEIVPAYFGAAGDDGDAERSALAEEIALHESIGQNYGFSWTHEIVKELPAAIYDELWARAQGKLNAAQLMLSFLSGVGRA